MLLLWDELVEPRAGDLEGLGRPALCELALRGVEGTLPFFEPAVSEYFPPDMLQVIVSTLAECHASPPSWTVSAGFVASFQESVDLLPSVPVRPGVGPFLGALELLVEAMSGAVDGDAVLEILSACYESVMVSQLTGRLTSDMQRENEKCRGVIAFQLSLVDEFTGRRP